MGVFSLSWQMVGMWGIAILLLYLGVAKQYEPLLMVPIAFGALIANIPDNGMLITQLNQQVISSNEQGEVTATSLNNVGYLRVHVAPLQQAPSKVPANLTTPESRSQYQEIMQQPMQVYPGSQLTVSKIKSVRESQEKAKADAALLGDDSLTVDPNLKDFQNVTEDNGNEPVFLLTNGEGTTVVRQQGVNYFDTSGNRIPVDLKTQKLEPLVVSAAGKYVAVGQHTQELLVTSIHGGLYDWIGLGIKAEIFPPIIFLGVGALTDFGPLLAAPRTLLLGAAAQVGVAATFFMALFMGFTPNESASIGIIGGADGPTSIFLTMKDDVDDFILGCLNQAFRHLAFAQEVAKHQHADQRGCVRNQQNGDNGYQHGEEQFFALADRSQGFHADEAFLLGRQQRATASCSRKRC